MRIRGDFWLLTTIKEVTKDLDVENGISYEGQEIVGLEGFFGRVIIRYHKYHQGIDRMYNEVADKLEVVQILPDTFDDDGFPGYDNVCIDYPTLKRIIGSGKSDWKAALENQKAVYLLTDTKTGKLYVESATSANGMLLQRWKNYVSNGHGGNRQLRALIEEEGFDYVRDHFQYSILENFNAREDDARILQREAYWKRVLRSREFGYNGN